jgi:hypothetical protein
LGQELGVADLGSGAAFGTARLPAVPSDGDFNSDGSIFAYRVGSDTGGLSTHMFAVGQDRTLLTRPGIGGHGGAPYGPAIQLTFSANGKYLLSVDSLFARFASGPPNFLVYDLTGSTVFQSSIAAFGAWASQGAQLYFLAGRQQGDIGGEVHRWDPATGEVRIAQGVSSYFWPAAGPNDGRLVFDSYDGSGLPHLWSVDLGTGQAAQISMATSSHPVFVGAGVVWSGAEEPCDCGPGGRSRPTGKVLAHTFGAGRDDPVDLTPLTPDSNPMNAVVDVWPR